MDVTTVPAGKTAKYKVEITRTDAALGEWAFGSLTWVPKADTRGKSGKPSKLGQVESVHSPIALRPVAVSAPDEVMGAGTRGSTAITVTPGITGTLTTDVDGLVSSAIETRTVTHAEPVITMADLFTVPPGTKALRLGTYGEEVQAKDIDLYLYRLGSGGLSQVDLSGSEGSTEQITLKDPLAGSYYLLIDLYSAEKSVSVPVHRWLLDDTSAGNLIVDPASASVTMTQPVSFTASWSDLDATKRYLGQVNFLEGDNVAGSTLVTVNA